MHLMLGRIALTTGMAALLLSVPVAALADSAPPLSGEASTERQVAEPSGAVAPGPEGQLTVTDVRVGTHDGFDRVTFELVGDSQVVWFIEYTEDPRQDGSGFEVDVAGNTALHVRLHSIAMPPDGPEGAEAFLDDVDGPPGGVVLEVINDTIFEGYQTFFIGLEEELPYRVARLEDPQRVAIDIVHATDEAPVPADGVEAGFGGLSSDSPIGGAVLTLGALLLVVGSGVALRSRAGG
jgi:hypothetical protein